MRTIPPHILPGCDYCNNDHDPDIQCRFMPESVRFQLVQPRPAIVIRRELIKNDAGKTIAVRTTTIDARTIREE